MAALEARVVAVAEDMSPQAVANALWGFATARWELGEESWRALQTQVARRGHDGFSGDLTLPRNVARDDRGGFFREEKNSRRRTTFNAQETANVAWAVARLGWSPEEDTWRGLNASVARNARDMDGRAIAVTLWAYATLGERPSEDARDALESAILSFSRSREKNKNDGSERERETKETFRARDVSNIWWAFVTLELAPRDATRIALARVSARILTESPDLTPADVANQSWAIAALEHLESEADDDADGVNDARRRAAHGETRSRHSTRHAAATAEWCRAVETAEARLFSFFAQGEGSEKAPSAEAREKHLLFSPSDVSGAMLNVAANSARRARLRKSENGKPSSARLASAKPREGKSRLARWRRRWKLPGETNKRDAPRRAERLVWPWRFSGGDAAPGSRHTRGGRRASPRLARTRRRSPGLGGPRSAPRLPQACPAHGGLFARGSLRRASPPRWPRSGPNSMPPGTRRGARPWTSPGSSSTPSRGTRGRLSRARSGTCRTGSS